MPLGTVLWGLGLEGLPPLPPPQLGLELGVWGERVGGCAPISLVSRLPCTGSGPPRGGS